MPRLRFLPLALLSACSSPPATVDLAVEDLAVADLAAPADLSVDLAVPDLAPPPDATLLDLRVPDLAPPPDGVVLDLEMPDLVAPPDEVAPPDGTVLDMTCGIIGGPCCQGDSCLDAATACAKGVCVHCGDRGEPCCGMTCAMGLACAADGKCGCGAKDQSCCGGTDCDPGLRCRAGACRCGDVAGDVCCPGDPPSCAGKLVCGGTGCGCVTGLRGAAGYPHMLALRSDGTVWYFLNIGQGQPDPVVVTAVNKADGQKLADVTSVSVGGYHACARVSDGGRVLCWPLGSQLDAANANGQLGNGNLLPAPTRSPAEVVDGKGGVLKDAARIAGAPRTTCAVMAAGEVRCWGYNGGGTLGDGTKTSSPVPLTVKLDDGSPLSSVDQVAVGDGHACALRSDGTLWCWGRNDSGQLGIGSNDLERPRPSQVTDLGKLVRQVSVDGDATCAVTTDGNLWCWGSNNYGQLGDGSSSGSAHSPRQLRASGKAFSPARSVAVFSQGACATKDDGSLWCWGSLWSGGLSPTQYTDHTGAGVANAWILDRANTLPAFVRTDGTAWLGSIWDYALQVKGFPCP